MFDPPQDTSLNAYQLPAQVRQILRELMCFGCGLRLGRHRYGDDACPNTHWRPGNGQPQWREGWKFKEAR